MRRRAAVHLLGDQAVLIELGRRVDTAANSRAIALARALRQRRGVLEATPGYASVTLRYDPERIQPDTIQRAAVRVLNEKAPAPGMGRLHRVPVIYDGPDLEETARALNLSVGELIHLHTEPTYRCFMIGFVPGWAYLGPLPERIRLPRRPVPGPPSPPGRSRSRGHRLVSTRFPPPAAGISWGEPCCPCFSLTRTLPASSSPATGFASFRSSAVAWGSRRS